LKAPLPGLRTEEKRSWVEKVTDEDNNWLIARNFEKDKFYKKAANYYLKDAKEQKEKNPLRSALSTSCAGRCLALAGNINGASLLYDRATRLYESIQNLTQGCDPKDDWLTERISFCRSQAWELTNGKPKPSEPPGWSP